MLNLRSLDPLIELAFEEDIGIGDITTDATVPSTRKGIGTFLTKSEGIVAGLPVAERVFEKLDPTLTFRTLVNDGDAVIVGTPIAEVQGSAQKHPNRRADGTKLFATTLWNRHPHRTICGSRRGLRYQNRGHSENCSRMAGSSEICCTRRGRAKPSLRSLRRCTH